MRRPPTWLQVLCAFHLAAGGYIVLALHASLPTMDLMVDLPAGPRGEASRIVLTYLTGALYVGIGIGLWVGEPLAWWVALALAMDDVLTSSFLALGIVELRLPAAGLLAIYVLVRADTRAHVGVEVRHRRGAKPTPAQPSVE